ncbi:MAG TPA: tetratricopeptide repeat protein [Jatrophihabitans sp.]|uniref:tetratricopeptide repeat protein n=1 Tax=Jatrophihabitans sp. TaxID=1932789 RepID=UPI002EE69800
MVGVPPERVLLVKADLPGGEKVSVGSATLIAARLVLTAAHVVFDESSGAPLTSIVVGPPEAPRLFEARVCWPAEHRSSASAADLDVALLEIIDRDWSPPPMGPVRWGRLTGRSPDVRCEATGFPRVQREPNGVRESDQISATINPAGGVVTGRHDLNITSAAPVPNDKFPSPWSGSSGAGVFCDGLLTAVLVIDTDGYGHGRLTAIPAYRFMADEGFRTLLIQHQVPAVLDSVELAPLLTTAAQQSQIRRRRPERTSPAMLLRADYETVDFYGRTELLTELVEWCTDSHADIDVRLITGQGGLGKTRLARQLVTAVNGRPSAHGQHSATQHAGRAWLAGFLSEPTAQNQLPVDRLADTAAPVLLVIDYAETRAAEIADLLRRLWAGDGAPVRLLLLARAAGEWWDQLARDLAGPVGATEQLAPLDTTATARAAAFETAVSAFATRLPTLPTIVPGVDWAAHAQALTPPSDLDDSGYGSPLTLQLAALLRLLATADANPPASGSPGSVAAEQELISRHEQKYWAATAPARLGLHRDSLAQAVTVATLCGAASRDEALAVLTPLPGMQQRTEDDRKAVADWLSELYPAASGHEWGGLQPDRMGEHLVADILSRRPSLLLQLMNAASHAQQHQALTVLARVLANPTVSDSTKDQLHQQLIDLFSGSDLGLALAGLALQVITETAEPQPLLAAVTTAADTFGPRQLSSFANQMPDQSLILAEAAVHLSAALVQALRRLPNSDTKPHLSSALNNLSIRLADLGRREEALIAITEATDHYRALATAQPEAFTSDLATSLNNLSNRLADLGRREEALTTINEAVRLRRALADAQPDAFTPELATSLNNLSNRLADLGRREEALTAITEAVQLRRALATAQPEAFTPDLAGSLNNMSIRLADLGRREKALAAITEAVQLRRALATARPDSFTPDLATSLNNLSNRLAALGRREEALAAITEAVQLRRALAAAQPEAFTPNLAASLNNLSNGLAGLGRHEEALAAITEAVQLRRALAAARPDAFTADLAMSLNNLTGGLADLGRHEEALTAITEATDLSRALAAARPEAFAPDLAGSLNNLSNELADLGRHEEALTTITEATDLYRALAAARPEVFTPDLARSLNNLSNGLADLGRHEEALTVITEAVQLRRALAAARPEAFTPDLARSLNNLSNRLADLGRREEALTAIIEATDLYRALATVRPDAFTSDLATSLNNLSNGLAALGHREEALTAITEAVQLRRALADAQPDAFTPDLAQSLVRLGIYLSALSQHVAARDADEEAATLYVRLAAELDHFEEAATRALKNLAIDLRELGMPPDEITKYLERVIRDAGDGPRRSAG